MIESSRRAPEMREGARDRLFAMRALGIFADLDEDGATLLAEYSKLTSFKTGEHVTRREREVASVHVVIDGLIEVTRPDGARVEIGAGRPVGLLGTVSRSNLNLDAVALRPTRTLEIPRGEFLGALEENFSLLRNVLRTVAGTLLDARGNLPLASKDIGAQAPLPTTTIGRQSLVQRVLEVGRVPIFRDANIDSAFDLARALREISVPAGHVFWKVGDPATGSLRVAAGRVRCTTPDGRFVDVSGDYMLGTLNTLAGRPEGYEARALEPVFGYMVDFEEFLIVLEAHPELALGLLANLATLVLQTRQGQDSAV